MNPLLRITSCTLAALGFAHDAAAEAAGTLLFVQPGTHIVSASSVARATKKRICVADQRALADTGGVPSQVLLPDGSPIGLRPDSELNIAAASAGSGPCLA